MTTGRINQVTASVFAGPEGPHRRASAFHGTTPCILRAAGCWHTRRRPATAFRYVLALPQIGLPPRHLSSACGHEGRQRRRLGQPCNRPCKLCARAVMRHFATRGQLEFVCPWSLVPFVRSQGQAPPAPGDHGHRVPRGAEAVLHCQASASFASDRQ